MHLNVLLLCVIIFFWILITHENFYGSSFMTSDTSGFTVYEATTVIRQLRDTYCEIFGMKMLAMYSFCDNELRNAIDRCTVTAKKNR